MELKTWLLIVRVLNCLSALLLIAFQIWFLVELFTQNRTIYGVALRISAPIFVSMLGLLIIVSQFKYQKIVENFKFLQWLPGLALFNLFMASILAFQFSTVDQTTSIVLASIFTAIALIFLIVGLFKPQGSRGLLSEQLGIVV